MMEDYSSLNSDEAHRPRVRTMTGSSIGSGSFSSYLLPHEKDARAAEATTPRMVVSHKARTVTPTPSLTREEELEQELAEAQWEKSEALEALRQLAQGVRIVTRQIKKQSHEQQEDEADNVIDESSLPSASCTSSIQSSCVSEHDRQISHITRELDHCHGGGAVGADLLNLSHAAQMVKENIKLVSQEADDLVEDCSRAQQQEKEATERALKAERLVKKLYKENAALQKQVDSLRAEKKLLKKECKTLHQERAMQQQQEHKSLHNGMLRAMEEYVAGALQVHERQLAKASEKQSAASSITNKEEQVSSEHEEIKESLSTKNSQDDQEEVEQEPASQSFKPRMGFGGAGALGFGAFKKKPSQSTPPIRSVSSRDNSEASLSFMSSKMSLAATNTILKQAQTTPAQSTSNNSAPTSYKPLTFVTPMRTTDAPSTTMSSSSSKKEEQYYLGKHVKNFFQGTSSSAAPQEEKQTALIKLHEEEEESTSVQPSAMVESRSPTDSPDLQQQQQQEGEINNTRQHDPSPATARSVVLPEDIQFDGEEMSDFLLSPMDDSPCTNGEAKSVVVPFESNLLRSLAVPQTPLVMRPRPSPNHDGLYEC